MTPSEPIDELIDGFEDGELAPAWRSEFDTSQDRTGQDGGREAYTVQSEIAPQGQYALRGRKDLYKDGSSTILRDDFQLTTDGASMQFYAKLGPILDSFERDNRISLLSQDLEQSVVRVRNKRKAEWGNLIVSEAFETMQLVEIRDIRFSDSVVGSVAIGGDVVATNLPFDSGIESVGAIQLRQGHYNPRTDLVIDGIAASTGDG